MDRQWRRDRMTHKSQIGALVIGGRGFIGSHICKLLEERGYSRVSSYDLVDGQDTLDLERLEKEVASHAVVFDCSGMLGSAETFGYAWLTFTVNVKGTLNVLEAARRHSVPVVFLSLKNKWLNPYMISKRAATELCGMYRDYHGLDVSVVRGLNAYGPGQHWGHVQKVVPTFIVQALRNEPLTVFGDGGQIIDLIHVRDLAEIAVRLFEQSCWGVVIDAGSAVPITVLELAELVIGLCESSSTVSFEPMRIGEPPGAVAIADATQAKATVGYYPQTNLVEGMRETVAWYRENWRSAYRGAVWDRDPGDRSL